MRSSSSEVVLSATVSRQALLDALGVASRAVTGVTSIPVLACARVRTLGDAIEVSATDLDASVRASVPASFAGKADVCVPAKRLRDVVSALAGADVKIEVKSGAVVLRSGGARMSMVATDGENFPTIPVRFDGSPRYTTRADALLWAIESAFPVSANAKAAVHAAGALFERGDGWVRMTATDGHRIHSATAPAAGVEGWKATPVFLAQDGLKALRDVLRISGDREVTIEDGQPDSAGESQHLVFVVNHVEVILRRGEGKFPAYDHLLRPSSYSRPMTLGVDSTAAIVRRVALIGDRLSVFTGAEGEPVVVACAMDGELSRDELSQHQWPGGDPVSFTLNPDYFLGVLEACGVEQVTLHLNEVNDVMHPVVIDHEKRDDGRDFCAVLAMMEEAPEVRRARLNAW